MGYNIVIPQVLFARYYYRFRCLVIRFTFCLSYLFMKVNSVWYPKYDSLLPSYLSASTYDQHSLHCHQNDLLGSHGPPGPGMTLDREKTENLLLRSPGSQN